MIDITNQEDVKKEILNITKQYYPEVKITKTIFQVVRKDYNYADEYWMDNEIIIETHSKISDALISASALNKANHIVSKFYVNQIEVME